jgi:isocitrate dehydrogenase (NAD+)
MTKHTVVLIPGDGIGPEVTEAVQRILSAAAAPVQWIEYQAGLTALQQGKDLLPEDALSAIRTHCVALKGPCTTPVGEGFTSINVSLRKKLNLYAAVRPVRNLDGVATRYQGVDLVIVRENTEGLYSGVENQVTDGVVMSMKVATEAACVRIARWAFQFAVRRQRKKVTAVHKANIMKLTDGLFLRCARQVHEREFPQVPYSEVIVDAACAKLVQDPTQFDVLLMENLYGDLLSDLCAGLVGGLGVTPGANIGNDAAVFEAVHGSAPDIAGKGIANPLALTMSAVMMLNHLADTRDCAASRKAAEAIKSAYNAALAAGEKTRDLGGTLSTAAFADAIIARLPTC